MGRKQTQLLRAESSPSLQVLRLFRVSQKAVVQYQTSNTTQANVGYSDTALNIKLREKGQLLAKFPS